MHLESMTGWLFLTVCIICDWFASLIVAIEFDKLVRLIQRQHNVSEPVPPFYIQTLGSLEVSINTAAAKEKEAKKKMSATNAKALTAVKQKVRRANREYESEIKKYQEV
jgi:translation initiation factor 3 subunit C